MTTYVAVLGVGLSALLHPVPRLIWNASASVPIELYAVHPASALRANTLAWISHRVLRLEIV